MEENNKIVVDTEILEGAPEELVTEVSVEEVTGGVSVGKVILGIGVVGLIAYGGYRVYKHFKNKKAADYFDEEGFDDADDQYFEDETENEEAVNPAEDSDK